ncbi:putative RNA binding protein [Hordeum vulgare]|nr:putative RNA binding protein [Hordeum vulgare]
MTVPRKKTQRDLRRLEKAEKTAQLDKSIESELKERLRKGVYGEIYNFPFKQFDTILDMEKYELAPEIEEEEDSTDSENQANFVMFSLLTIFPIYCGFTCQYRKAR